jgi:uncharacterized protein YyaL (SSP411 family)/uncharacterized protein (DUF1499 family)
MKSSSIVFAVALCGAARLAGAAGLGLVDGKLAPCPSAPHCVSSQSPDAGHAVAPIAFTGEPAAAWKRLKATLEKIPRLKLVEEKEGYLHLVAASRIMRFKDDLEFALLPGASSIEVRSSARIGYYDMKANRERVELIRELFARQPQVATAASTIKWDDWSDAAFTRAKKQKRLVILDLEAVWCHWCHVMDEQTYGDPAVIALLDASFVTVRVDQDARPDLAARYQDYGWPATILFDENGRELAKRRGFVAPEAMVSMLKAFVADPTPGPSITAPEVLTLSSNSALSPAFRRKLSKQYEQQYDAELGSWGRPLKYLDWDGVELALSAAKDGNAPYKRMAVQTLDAQKALLDPVWGGVYQYSAGGGWKEPHFEKIMNMQAQNLRVYSLAYAQTRDAAYLAAAKSIARFLRDFLTSPDGALYASQDADLVPGRHSADYFALDDAGRRKQGVPRVDAHVYARENGWAIRGLTAMATAAADEEALGAARRSAEQMLRTRSLPGGGFRHGENDAAGPYLGDTLAMGQAFLDLHAATGERVWLERAEAAARFIEQRFASAPGAPAETGFVSAPVEGAGLAAVIDRDENVAAARFFNLLSRYTGNNADRALARRAMTYLAIPSVARRFEPAGILLADRELNSEPLHMTVVGAKNSSAAKKLFTQALKYPCGYRRVEWWDPQEGPLPNPDTHYPPLDPPALFACGSGWCSSPLRDAASVEDTIDGLMRANARAARQ